MATANDVATMIEHLLPSVGPAGLQKLTYYSQAWSLAWTGRKLFDDKIEAWPQGPVVRATWKDRDTGRHSGSAAALTQDQQSVVATVVEHYRKWAGSELIQMTHREQPWLEARDGLPAGAYSNAEVNTSTMRRYYTSESIKGGGPAYSAPSRDVSPATIRGAGRRASGRWSETLRILAE